MAVQLLQELHVTKASHYELQALGQFLVVTATEGRVFKMIRAEKKSRMSH
jgi:hypothetical protein